MQLTYVYDEEISDESGALRVDALRAASANESENFWTPSRLERRGHVLVVDPGLGERLQERARLVHALGQRVADDTVILERLRSSRTASCSPCLAR